MIREDLRNISMDGLAGALIALPILGVGSRSLMRVIAHWEGRVPVLTFNGTTTVLFAAMMAGLAAGLTYGILKRFVSSGLIRHTVFLALCVVFTWRAVNELLPRPRLMFVALTLIYAAVLEVWFSRKRAAMPGDPSELAPVSP